MTKASNPVGQGQHRLSDCRMQFSRINTVELFLSIQLLESGVLDLWDLIIFAFSLFSIPWLLLLPVCKRSWRMSIMIIFGSEFGDSEVSACVSSHFDPATINLPTSALRCSCLATCFDGCHHFLKVDNCVVVRSLAGLLFRFLYLL